MQTLSPSTPPGIRMLEASIRYLDRVAAAIGLDPNVHRYLRAPKRELSVSLPVVMDSGNLELFTGYRVQHILAVGPTKGGIRYGLDVDVDTLRALAMANTWKNAVVGLHFGGAEGGVCCDPRSLSEGELERLTRRYASEMNIIMGPEKDIPEPDLHTDEQIMAWMMDTYSMDVGFSVPGVVTGKPRSIGGSMGQSDTRAWGAMYVIRAVLKRRQESVQGWKVAIQGVSALALQLGRLMQADGATVVAVADETATVRDERGLNLDDLAARLRDKGSLKGSGVGPEAVLETDCDLLVLGLSGAGVDDANEGRVKARILVELAPSAVAFSLDDRLQKVGCLLIPEILTQAGAVTAQYVEWVQDIQSFFWDEREVGEKLEHLLNTCLSHVFETAAQVEGNLRLASHMIAVRRVAEALRLRGIYP